MPTIVLLRGANVGTKRFSPKAVEQELSDLRITSIGAAGTFVVRKHAAATTLTKRFEKTLPFEPELLFFERSEFLKAVELGRTLPIPENAIRFATALAKQVPTPDLPIEAPDGSPWALRLDAMEGKIIVGVRRRFSETGVYPNEVVEKSFQVRATTRDWNTMEKIAKLLDD